MFVSGSWKFTRQKDTERFFETLKERIEQSSKICKVDPSATQQIIEGETNFISLKNQTNINISNGSTEQLAAFVVAKPDIRAIGLFDFNNHEHIEAMKDIAKKAIVVIKPRLFGRFGAKDIIADKLKESLKNEIHKKTGKVPVIDVMVNFI